jgi:peroxiredoxin Q/BCP
VGDNGVEPIDECDEERQAADGLVHRDVVFHVVDTRVVVVKTGDKVDDFELPDETGTTRKLSDLLLDGPVVLFFYPAAMTMGCTKESCHFRDLAAEFKEAGGQRVGISADTVEKQKEFSDKHSFDYPLLADTDRKVAAQFGVKRGFGISPTKRSTFVIDTDSTVLAVINSEISMNTHADKALKVLSERAS